METDGNLKKLCQNTLVCGVGVERDRGLGGREEGKVFFFLFAYVRIE